MMSSISARCLGRRIFLLLSMIAIFSFLAGCNRQPSNQLQGYLEGEFVYVSSPLAGTLEKLHVQRGGQVQTGDLLFELTNVPEKSARDEAERRLLQARANLEDLKKGKRPSEIESIEAQIKQAQAALELSEKELTRQETLIRSAGATTPQEVDRARSARDQNRQHAVELQADLQTSRLGSRSDQIAAAEANVRALEAALTKGEWDLSQKRQAANQSAFVFDTLYREGEWVAAGRPIVSLLPPANVKLRVFVPEGWLSRVHVGDSLQVFVDRAGGTVAGKVSFIAPRSEYTPPVIYSRQNRNKLVFLVEAVFETAIAEKLHPGQPVDVQFNFPPP